MSNQEQFDEIIVKSSLDPYTSIGVKSILAEFLPVPEFIEEQTIQEVPYSGASMAGLF